MTQKNEEPERNELKGMITKEAIEYFWGGCVAITLFIAGIIVVLYLWAGMGWIAQTILKGVGLL